MITKIIPWDVFSPVLQPGESRDYPIDIIAGTNQVWVNTRGVIHEVGTRYNQIFLNLLKESHDSSVPLGHVFSAEWMIDAQRANFHAIAVNKREEAGWPQDWSQLLESLGTGLEYLYLNQNTYEDNTVFDDSHFVDRELQDLIARIQPKEWVDYAAQVSSLVNHYIELTRRKFRVVLIGGADGLKNHANLVDTIEALEASRLILHLYLWNIDKAAIGEVIRWIPSLQERELLVA